MEMFLPWNFPLKIVMIRFKNIMLPKNPKDLPQNWSSCGKRTSKQVAKPGQGPASEPGADHDDAFRRDGLWVEGQISAWLRRLRFEGRKLMQGTQSRGTKSKNQQVGPHETNRLRTAKETTNQVRKQPTPREASLASHIP